MADITLHPESTTLRQIQNQVGNLYLVFSDSEGNLHGYAVGAATGEGRGALWYIKAPVD